MKPKTIKKKKEDFNMYKQKCECGESVSAPTLHLLKYYKKENILNNGYCKLFKRHHYK